MVPYKKFLRYQVCSLVCWLDVFTSVLVAGIPFHDNVFCVSNIHFTYSPPLSLLLLLLSLSLNYLKYCLSMFSVLGAWLALFQNLFTTTTLSFMVKLCVCFTSRNEGERVLGNERGFVLDQSNQFAKMPSFAFGNWWNDDARNCRNSST